jgi:transposase
MAEARRRFDREFRAGAVRVVWEIGKPIAQVVWDLGINEGTLSNWANQDRRARGEAAGGGSSEDERAELIRLRREDAELPRRSRRIITKTPKSVSNWVRPRPPGGTSGSSHCSSDRWSCGSRRR